MTRSNLLARSLAVLLIAIPVIALAQDAFTNRTVNVRAGPDPSYPVVAAIGAGAPVQVMGCLDDWSWCDVAFADNRGWVYAPYLTYAYQGVRVPFYDYAPSFGIPIITFSIGSYWDRYYRGRPWYGRRDYWVNRSPPSHMRPQGPPPRTVARSEMRVLQSPRTETQAATRVVPSSPASQVHEGHRPPPSGPSVAPSAERRHPSGPTVATPALSRSVQAAPTPRGRGGEQGGNRQESKGGERSVQATPHGGGGEHRAPEGHASDEKEKAR